MSLSLMAACAHIVVVHSLPSMSLHVKPPLRNLADLKLGSKYPSFLLKANCCILLIPQFPLLQGAFCLQKADASLCSLPRSLNPFLHRVKWEELNKTTCYTPGPPKNSHQNSLTKLYALEGTEAQKAPINGRELSFPFLKIPPVLMSYLLEFPFT